MIYLLANEPEQNARKSATKIDAHYARQHVLQRHLRYPLIIPWETNNAIEPKHRINNPRPDGIQKKGAARSVCYCQEIR